MIKELEVGTGLSRVVHYTVEEITEEELHLRNHDTNEIETISKVEITEELSEIEGGNALVDFSEALHYVKQGYKIARNGWNGKNMYVVHQAGYPEGIKINKNTSEATGIEEGTLCNFRPYLMLKTADEQPTFVPWVITQSDALADDWYIVAE